MKTITLADAHRILTDCSAVYLVDQNGGLMVPSMADLTGKDDNEFLYLSWCRRGLEFTAKLQESNNREVKVEGSSMFLTDDEGEEVQLTILVPAKLEDAPAVEIDSKFMAPTPTQPSCTEHFHVGQTVNVRRKEDGYDLFNHDFTGTIKKITPKYVVVVDQDDDCWDVDTDQLSVNLT